MEEKKENKKLSYDELKQHFDELYMQYQKLVNQYQQAVQTMNNFDQTSFLLQAMFKVMDHSDKYKPEFVKWCVDNIEGALIGLSESLNGTQEEEKKDEAK